MRVYLQYPWKFFPDSPCYRSIVQNPPEGITYLNTGNQEGVITKSKKFKFSHKLKINLRRMIDISRLNESIKRGSFHLRGFERVLIGTGLYLAITEGKQLEIRSRSGVALKRGLLVANQPGTIDPDYRGEVGVIVFNSTPYLNKLLIGERIAQAVLTSFDRIQWDPVGELPPTARGSDGFGSSGS